MAKESPQEWRQRRLIELSSKFDSKAELGRKLGFRDGAYVGQMTAGLRPITEKLIQKAEALPGCAGWFDRGAALPKGSVFDALSTEEKELIAHFRHLLGKDRRAKLAEIAELAKERLAEREELFAEAGVTRIAERAANAVRGRAATATVDLAAKLKQRSLLGDDEK